MVILLIIGFILITLFELSIVYKSNNKIKTLILSLFLISISFTISLLLVLDKAPTSPAVIIERILNVIIQR